MLFARLALVLVAIQTTSAEQTPLTSEIRPIITPEFTHFVETLRESESVPGIALGVVHEGRTVANSWGIRSEDGTNVTSDVSTIAFTQHSLPTSVHFADSFRHRFLLKGVCIRCIGHSDR